MVPSHNKLVSQPLFCPPATRVTNFVFKIANLVTSCNIHSVTPQNDKKAYSELYKYYADTTIAVHCMKTLTSRQQSTFILLAVMVYR